MNIILRKISEYNSADPNAELEIPSMPDVKRWGLHRIISHLKPLVELGLKSVLIFGVPNDSVKVGNSS